MRSQSTNQTWSVYDRVKVVAITPPPTPPAYTVHHKSVRARATKLIIFNHTLRIIFAARRLLRDLRSRPTFSLVNFPTPLHLHRCRTHTRTRLVSRKHACRYYTHRATRENFPLRPGARWARLGAWFIMQICAAGEFFQRKMWQRRRHRRETRYRVSTQRCG